MRMMQTLWKRWFAILSVALLATACADTSSYRYRMTVEVDTPEGLRVGSAVREVTITRPPNIPMLGESRIQRSVRGEAVAVDLPDGKVLFALSIGENGDTLQPHLGISTLFREKGTRMPRPIELWPANPKTQTPQFETLIPMLVTFGDLDDPISVEKVDPKDLTATFGEGVSLKRITVQVTDDRVTSGIEQRLGWLGQLREMGLQSDSFPENKPLGNFSFRSGE